MSDTDTLSTNPTQAGPSANQRIVLVVPLSRTHYVVPPIGLGYLATALRKEGFNDIVVIDCLKDNLNTPRLRARLEELQPAVVGFQMFSYDFSAVVSAICSLRNVLPDAVVVLGGPHVSAVGAEVLKEIPTADFAIAGEGEIGFPMLMKHVLREEPIRLESIPGIIYRDERRARMIGRGFVPDLDALGFPAWDLMAPGEYPDSPQGGFYMNFPIAPISTTRGCPYPCAFCGSAVNMGKKLRFRSIQTVLAEMRVLYDDYGVREFHIIDDMFNYKKERVAEFCKGIKDQGMEISYTFPNGLRLNHLDMEMLQMMKETGAYAFNVGIESGSQRILDKMKKKLTLELIEEKVNLINEAGLEPCGFFIIGFPGETEEDIEATIRFAKKLKLKRAHFSNFLPLPGTPATQDLLACGEIEPPSWDSLFYARVAYAPKGMTRKRLKALQRKAYLSFHLRPSILFRMLREIRSFNHFKLTLKRIRDYLFRR